tara:strand:+ start:52 stop:216 length:165 start_codon:yes stop_codon:yes gene_type:complete
MAKREFFMCHPMHWDEAGEVRVMARADGYAMVRRKGCMPFAVSEKDLSPKERPK